jgi:hypothetical protein
VNIDIEINIGVGVPRHIEFYPLPPEIIEIVPIYEGYLFCILEDGTILIIHPAEYEIVYVITPDKRAAPAPVGAAHAALC